MSCSTIWRRCAGSRLIEETGVTRTIDPLAGSYYVEHLTNELERQAYDYFDRIEQLGGVIPAIKENFFQREIAEASFRYQSEVESGKRGVDEILARTAAPSSPMAMTQIRILGGAMARVDAEATAFAHREAEVERRAAALIFLQPDRIGDRAGDDHRILIAAAAWNRIVKGPVARGGSGI